MPLFLIIRMTKYFLIDNERQQKTMKDKKFLKRQNIDYNIIWEIENMKDNPFNITFGKTPLKLIYRQNTIDHVINTFNNKNPNVESYIITGPRGCGKTVLLAQIIKEFDSMDNWISIDLNPCMEMLEQAAVRLYDSAKIKNLFIKKEFSFSFKGVSFSLIGDKKIKDIFSLLKQMLEYLKRKNIKVLFTVDDIAKNDYVKAFVQAYQSLIRQGYSLYFIATGIYNNVSSLYSDKSLTFLLRAPKILVEPLSIRAIATTYKEIFKVDLETSINFAMFTCGYAYAFQILGSLLFKEKKYEITDKIKDEFDIIMEDRSYSQIWKELSKKERLVIETLANNKEMSHSELLNKLKMKNNEFQVYRKSLLFSGLIISDKRGSIKLALPRFKEFVLFTAYIEGDK